MDFESADRLKGASIEWVRENAARFVCPGREYWPDYVDSRDEAIKYYGIELANEIADKMAGTDQFATPSELLESDRDELDLEDVPEVKPIMFQDDLESLYPNTTMNDNELNDLAHDATGVTPKIGEVLAMNYLLRQAIEDADDSGKHGLADLGRDFLSYYDSVEVTLAQQVRFEKEYVNYNE